MAVYLNLTAKARIKIQDPCDEKTINQVKEDTFINCPVELCEEDYEYTVEDAD